MTAGLVALHLRATGRLLLPEVSCIVLRRNRRASPNMHILCVHVSKRIPLAFFVEAQGSSLWAGPKQLSLSDVIEEVIDHFPHGENIQHTSLA